MFVGLSRFIAQSGSLAVQLVGWRFEPSQSHRVITARLIAVQRSRADGYIAHSSCSVCVVQSVAWLQQYLLKIQSQSSSACSIQ